MYGPVVMTGPFFCDECTISFPCAKKIKYYHFLYNKNQERSTKMGLILTEQKTELAECMRNDQKKRSKEIFGGKNILCLFYRLRKNGLI